MTDQNRRFLKNCFRIGFAALAFSGGYSPALASSYCKGAFSEKADATALDSWDQLPNVNLGNDVDAEFIQALRSHPALRPTIERLGDGGGYWISVADADAHYTGWNVQAHFVQKTLRILFPALTISPSTAGKGLWLKLIDPGMAYQRRSVSPTSQPKAVARTAPFLEMSIVKAANPGPALPSRAKIREQLSLPQDGQIISLYASRRLEVGETAEVFRAVMTRPQTKIIIFSAQGGETYKYINNSTVQNLARRLGFQIIHHTAWPRMDRDPEGRYIIANDTLMRLPYIHRAANAAVVAGPANFMEPITSETPTFFAAETEHYELNAWQKMAATARESGLAKSYEKTAELTDLLGTAHEMHSKNKLYFMRNSQGSTPINDFATNLASALEQLQ